MTNPLISIIIPTLNSREIIEAALETIDKQTFRDIEVILSDGGSSDDTVDFALRYLARASIKATAIVQPGSTVYRALNLAGRVAAGEWQYALGSDDKLYDPQVLSDVADRLRLSTADVCYGSAWNANANLLISCGEYTLDRFATENICHQGIFYRSEKIRRLGLEYAENYPLLADWDYNLRLFSQCRFDFIPRTIAIFSGTGKSSYGEDKKFRTDLEANMIQYFGLRTCYLLHPAHLKRGTMFRPRRGNRALLAANRFLYPMYKSWKCRIRPPSFHR